MHKIFKCQSCGTKYSIDDESEYDVSICKWCDKHYYFDEIKDKFINKEK